MKLRGWFLLIFAGLLLSGNAQIPEVKLNQTLGINFFSDTGMWSKKALEKRLSLRFRGNAKRFYTRFSRNVAGVRPVELEVITADDNDTIVIATFTFANQGDTVKKHRTGIAQSGRTIAKNISRLCGHKRKGSFSDGTHKIKGDMWQTRYAKLILEVDKGDFTLLHILPPGGMKKAANPGDKDFSKNVIRNQFGDVFIPNVPMVDQGQKGYCVPATVARIFLYYGIHADMHHLAKLGETDRENGTYSDTLFKEMNSIRRKARLKMKVYKDLSMNTIIQNIDNGYPLFWTIDGDLNKVYSFSGANRSKAASPDAWKRMLKNFSVNDFPSCGHVLLIIGYNRKTGEIAVSNSWGNTKPQWVEFRYAKRVSRAGTVVFSP